MILGQIQCCRCGFLPLAYKNEGEKETYKRATRLQGEISQEGVFFRGLGLDLILTFSSLVTVLADCDHHRGILNDTSAVLISQSDLEAFISQHSTLGCPAITTSSRRSSTTEIRILFYRHSIMYATFFPFVDVWELFSAAGRPECKQALTNH